MLRLSSASLWSAAYLPPDVKLACVATVGGVEIQSILDSMLPKLLPFAVTMGMYLYIKKRGPHYLRIIVVTMIAAVLLTGLGII